MSGKKQFKEQADEAFMRAVYDLQSDLTLGAGVDLAIELHRTPRKGVYELWIVATANPKVWASGGQVTYRREWPRSEVATLAAAFFQAITALDVMLGQEIAGEAWVARESPWEG
jgi:hypothetical protein